MVSNILNGLLCVAFGIMWCMAFGASCGVACGVWYFGLACGVRHLVWHALYGIWCGMCFVTFGVECGVAYCVWRVV